MHALRSGKTGRRYTGSCEDFARRFHEHNTGQATATRHGVPWTVIHFEQHATREAARRRERFLKTGKGRDELQRIAW